MSRRPFLAQLNLLNFFVFAPMNVGTYFGTPSWLRKELWDNGGVIRNPSQRHFPNIEKLREAFSIIKKEARNCMVASKPIKDDMYFTGIADDGWKRFYIKWYGPSDKLAKQICPETCALLDTMPEVHLAMFSILMPYSRIKPHFGPARMCLRYHIGISTPNDDKCFIELGGKTKYSWRDGEDVMFDDTLPHYVYNNTNTPRIILFLDVERPQQNGILKKFTQSQIKYIAPMTTRSNNKQEKAEK